MPSYQALQDRVLAIPHLDLQITFDLERLQAEAANITDYVPYNSIYSGEVVKKMYAEAWAGRSLVSFERDSRLGMHEHTREYEQKIRAERRQLAPTDLANECPCMMDTVRALSGDKHRARIMRIAAGKSLVWHSHVRQHRQPARILTVHVPVFMPPDFTYSVVHPDKLNGQRPAPQDRYEARYAPGRATVFNSYHFHNVFNPSGTDRVSIMMYLDLEDPTVFRMVSRAVDAYTGPLVS